MLSVIAAPETAPQIFNPPPAQRPKPRLDRLDQRLLEIVRDEGTAGIWWLLNKIGDEEAPGDRAKARAVRLSLWHRLKRLLWLGLLFRDERKTVGVLPPPPRPASPRQARSSQRIGRRMQRATTRPPRSGQEVSTDGCENPDWTKIPVGQPEFQLVGRNLRDDDTTETVPQSKSASTREELATAARQLATLPRGRKKLSGWLNDRDRIWRDRKILVDGHPAWAYGCLRGRVIFFLDRPRLLEPGRWGVIGSGKIRLLKNEAAVVLARAKAGIKEKPSDRKKETCRINGCKACSPGRKRGRPKRVGI